MINDTEEQEHVGKKYFDQYQQDEGQADNHMTSHGKEVQQPTLRKLLQAQSDYRGCTQAALSFGLP